MRVLITGATGSLGHALVRYFLQETDWRLIVFSRDEKKQADMAALINDSRVDYRLGDVRDPGRLRLAFSGVDTVIHAAALKRVDAVASDPVEVFKTNVLGTWNVLEAALAQQVAKVLVISSDKACHAINAYGSSKFAAESLTVSFNTYGWPQGTEASVLRYGNVLGSRGSVVHVWRDQILRGKPATLTNEHSTRFIITMPQAVGLVHAALDAMNGGEVFVPRLPAATMVDLLSAVWQGMKPALMTDRGREFEANGGEIGVGLKITGSRPGGEKLHETLLTEEESMRSRDLGDYVTIVTPHLTPWTEAPSWLEEPRTLDGERRSDTAKRLSVAQLTELLKTVPDEGV